MNKKTLLIAGIVIVLLLGLGGFVLTSKSGKTVSETAGNAPVVTPAPQKMSLRSLLSFTGSQMCQFTDKESTTSGQLYMTGGKVRGDFTTTAGDMTVASHLYTDGRDMYVWMDGSQTGFKSSLTTAPTPTGEPSRENVDLDRRVEYSCQPWTADNSKFVLPSDVKFSDFSSLMVAPTGGKISPCDACNQLKGDTAAQCKKALNCP